MHGNWSFSKPGEYKLYTVDSSAPKGNKADNKETRY
ncbi:hypothetical protein [Corynebacterium diphtheriae]|nr:hypothetical protein FE378_11720 [Corynebacterium diphtheriae]